MMKILPFFVFAVSSFSYAIKTSDFNGDYIRRHSLYMMTEDKTVHNVEDLVKVQSVDDKKAHIIVETYTQNFQSCQLIGEAELQGEDLVFKSRVDKRLNRGKSASCLLKISIAKKDSGEKTVKIDDTDDNCRLQYCGMQAELGGEFPVKSTAEPALEKN